MSDLKKEPWLKQMFMLTDKGYQDTKKAIGACTITNFTLMLPFAMMTQMAMEVIRPLTGGEINFEKLWALFVLGIIAALCVFISSKNDYKKSYVASYMESGNTRIRMAEHIRKLPMHVFNSKDLAELTTNLMADVATSEQVISHVVPQLFSNSISIVMICFALAFFDWRMSLAMFCTVPLAFVTISATRRLQTYHGSKQNDAKVRAAGQAQEYIEGIKVIKACNLDGEKSKALEEALRSLRDLSIRYELVAGSIISASSIILQAGIGLVVFTGTRLISGGNIGLVTLLMFLLIVTRIYGPFLTELTLLPELFYHQIAIARMRRLMAIAPMEGSSEAEIGDFTICFDHVDFCYNEGGNAAVRDLTATFPAGSITALAGPSGCGKSTVSRLAARFWDTSSGSVTIGGVDVKTMDPEHLMGYMSFVFQDVVLFHDTVYNNIRIGNMDAGREEIIAAAEAANCSEFIDRLPDGYDTMLGENGSTLSGGERQRISIARALLKNAPIILLDEATASLDPENESQVQQAIGRLIEGRTVIVIAHRLRTIADADQILVLDRGRLKEQGTHDELISGKGLYYKLYTIQQQSLEWSI